MMSSPQSALGWARECGVVWPALAPYPRRWSALAGAVRTPVGVAVSLPDAASAGAGKLRRLGHPGLARIAWTAGSQPRAAASPS